MTAPIALVVVVAFQDAANPTLRALTSTVQDALGNGAHVVVAQSSDPASDDAASLEQSLRANAIVFVAWMGPARQHARIRVHKTSIDEWVVRDFDYAANDRPLERGRNLGFAIASIVADAAADGVSAATPVKPMAVGPLVAAATAPGAPWPPEPHDSLGSSPWAAPRAERPAAPLPMTRGTLAVGALASVGIGGAGGGLGGVARGDLFLTPFFSLQAMFSGRTGTVAAAHATSSVFGGGLGAAIHPVRATDARPWGVDVAIEGLALRQELTHFDSDDPRPVPESHWVPGAETFGTGVWMFSPGFGFFMDAGAEFSFGITRVYLHRNEVATLVPVHGIAALGVVGRF